MFRKMKSARKKEKKNIEYSGPIIVRKISEYTPLNDTKEEPPNQGTQENENSVPDHKEDKTIKHQNTKQQVQEQSAEENSNYHYRFEPNNKYFSICIYALVSLAIGMLIIMGIINLPFIAVFIKNFINIIQPFVAAFFIAFIINPIVKVIADRFFGDVCKIKKNKVRLALGILTSYVMLIGIIVGFCTYVIPQLMSSIEDLINRSSDLYNEAIKFLNSIETRFPELDMTLIEDKLNEAMPQLLQFGTDFVKNAIPAILNLSFSIAKITINLLLSIAISIYMLYDKRALSKNSTRVLYSIVPKKRADGMLVIVKQCGSIFTNFIVGKALDSTIIGIICFIIMSILKLPYAVLLSVIVGVTNMIPYFGPFIGAIPGVLLYICIDPLQALIFAIMILAIQQFDGWILGPKILGDSTGLTPLWVIFGITVGGAYGGVFGMFIGVPVVAVLAYLADLFISSRLKKKRIEIE